MPTNRTDRTALATGLVVHLLSIDELHSPLMAVSTSGKQTKAYLPYGFSPALQATGGRMGFNGQYAEPMTGHYLLGNGHRAYNPSLMCFLSSDRSSPFDGGGVNTYSYCQRDPINHSDPSGRVRENKPSPLNFFAGMHKAAKQMMFPGNKPVSESSAPRQRIDNEVVPDSMFNQGLITVNRSLATHDNQAISPRKADHYVALANSELSNSSKFFESSFQWSKRTVENPSPNRATGAVFNFLGAFLGGAEDHRGRKTGREIQGPWESAPSETQASLRREN
ncbi:RHS repeat-associated core domain-containing protein [Pseudomonas sichuanensis]|uniref:RHS repeat-associated core domain-containing protein n=1 Tax=Pseudomonas sichuanensis TaxID=2213015 RepID=UPI00216071FF|nr:RHS repeat-associated core domain-containing protein [Pseudomonas sichuanensis]UVK81699.1 RHS repeat-associated core domain-containing protein [Pseudomonas sichuanensis]